jgi:hypothetical protein
VAGSFGRLRTQGSATACKLLIMRRCAQSSVLTAGVSSGCAQVAILLCLMDVAAGMSYLHSVGLLHSDLKGANVLLKSSAVTPTDPRGFTCKVCSTDPKTPTRISVP